MIDFYVTQVILFVFSRFETVLHLIHTKLQIEKKNTSGGIRCTIK